MARDHGEEIGQKKNDILVFHTFRHDKATQESKGEY